MTQTAKERKPSSAGLQPADIAGAQQLHRSCQSFQFNLSLSIAHVSMCASFIVVESHLTSPAIHSCESGPKHPGRFLKLEESQEWWEDGTDGSSRYGSSQPALLTLPQPGSSCFSPLLLLPTPAAQELQKCCGEAHPSTLQCSQTTATAPAPLGLQLWHKPALNTSWKHTRSSPQRTSVG